MNIFFKKPEVAPVAALTPAVETAPVAPVAMKKPGFFSAITNPFAGSSSITREQKHQDSLVKMMEKLTGTKEVLYTDVFYSIKDEDFTKLLGYQRELNLLKTDQSITSPTFAKFKALLKPSLIDKVIKAGISLGASKEGGVAHAERQMNLGLLDAMRKAVNEALRGVNVSDAQKQAVTASAIDSIAADLKAAISKDVEAAKAVKGAPTLVSAETLEVAKTAEAAIKDLESNAILGDQMTKGESAKKLAPLKAQIEKQKAQFDKQVAQAEKQAAAAAAQAEKEKTIDAIKGVYQNADDKLAELIALEDQLNALSDRDDSTLGKSKKIEEEKTAIAEKMVALIKEIDTESTITVEDIKNPTSKTLATDVDEKIEGPITERFDYQKDRIKLIALKNVVAANQDFVSKLAEIQAKKGFFTRAFEYVSPSTEAKVLGVNKESLKEISALEKSTKAFEAKQKAIADAEARKAAAPTLFGRVKAISSTVSSFVSRLNPLAKKPVELSAKEQAEKAFQAAEEAYTSFVLQDDVIAVVEKEQDLEMALSKLDHKFYVRSSRRKEDKAKIQAQINSLKTEQAETFTQLTVLQTAREEALIALEAAERVEEAAEEAKKAAALEAKETEETTEVRTDFWGNHFE